LGPRATAAFFERPAAIVEHPVTPALAIPDFPNAVPHDLPAFSLTGWGAVIRRSAAQFLALQKLRVQT
jgi:hypothetical protein